MSTSFEGVLNPPPKTYIWLQKFTARVLLVGLRYVGNRGRWNQPPDHRQMSFVVSVRVPPVISAPPPV